MKRSNLHSEKTGEKLALETQGQEEQEMKDLNFTITEARGGAAVAKQPKTREDITIEIVPEQIARKFQESDE